MKCRRVSFLPLRTLVSSTSLSCPWTRLPAAHHRWDCPWTTPRQHLVSFFDGASMTTSRGRALAEGTSPRAFSVRPQQEFDGEIRPDLHSCLPRGRWAAPGNLPRLWVVFSDLHVSPSTLATSLEVLHAAHKEAVDRGAGIIFLGDFWHHRGALPVETLNRLVTMFASSWSIPTLMLVGNHDQVSLGGLVHALTPLAAAAPEGLVHVFDRPALFADALWLPYRRDRNEIKAAIDGAGTVSAVFAHADVIGGLFNAECQARDGLEPSLFPRKVPSYLGHYHKPHTVARTSIRYVGSPYQVSRSEAGQRKALLVLDREAAWHVTEEIPLDVGPRHWDVEWSEATTTCGSLELPPELRSGDRVRLRVFEDAADGGAQRKTVREYRSQVHARGAQLEVHTVPRAKKQEARIKDADRLSPRDLFLSFAAIQGMREGAVRCGIDILEETVTQQHADANVTLDFEHVEVEGYFSFKERQAYDLAKRGLVVLTGRIEGGTVSPHPGSNGAGKTALVMAPLWALTGHVDARSEGGGGRALTNASLVHDDAKEARVMVRGRVGNKPFEVERRVRSTNRGGGLKFAFDGEDLTMQEKAKTQEEINNKLGAALLGRAVFYGQSEITALLESSDRDFKKELGKLVDLEVWEVAKERVKTVLAAEKAALTECRKEIEVRGQFIARVRENLERAELAAQEREAASRAELEEVRARASGALALLERVCRQRSEALKTEMDAIESKNASHVGRLKTEAAALQQKAMAAERQRGALDADVAFRRGQLQSYENISAAAHCDRCLQPIDTEMQQKNAARLREELKQARAKAAAAALEADEASQRANEVSAALNQARDAARAEAAGLSDVQAQIVEATAVIGTLTRELGQPCQQQQPQPDDEDAFVEDLGVCVERARSCHAAYKQAATSARHQSAVEDVERLQHRLHQEENDVESVVLQKELITTRIQDLEAVYEAFRPKGVVSFAVEGALKALQEVTRRHLEVLAPDITLELLASRPSNKRDGALEVEEVQKKVFVRQRERSIKQLSGGERRRVALALALGFSELASERGRLKSNLLVLDEVTQHLDADGCARVAVLLRGLQGYDTVLLVAQAGSYFVDAMDAVDVVVFSHEEGGSRVEAS